MLQNLATELGVSKNQAVASAVREAWEKRRAHTYTLTVLDQISADREALLDRLAE